MTTQARRPRNAAARARAAAVVGGTELGREQVGEFELLEGQPFGEPRPLGQLELLACPPEGGGAGERIGDPGRDRWQPRGGRRPGRVLVEVREQRIAAVDDDRSEGDADLGLEPEGGLYRLVDGGLFGNRDEDDLAAGRVGEHRDDLVGLGPQRSAAGRVGEAARARQEAQRVAGRRGVEDDEVGSAGLLELADLAEDEHLADPGDRRRDDVERPSAHEAASEAAEAS